MSRYISEKMRLTISERAGNRCEYCLYPQQCRAVKYQVEHILPIKHGGNKEFENLAFACVACNLYKGTDIGSYDFETDGEFAPLFNPRTQIWSEHFRIDEDGIIEPLTATARVTIKILRFNDEERIEERRELIEAGLY